MRHLVEDGRSSAYSAALHQYVDCSSDKQNRDCIHDIYQVLRRKYRNEYFFKNTLLSKLLLGVHSLKTTSALEEVPVGKSKADFILINGKAVVYEIKTALDNFDRLEGQLKDYYKAFTRVVVVTSDSHFETARSLLLGTPVGIAVLTRDQHLSMRKKAEEDASSLDLLTIFKILRTYEFSSILEKLTGSVPDVSQFEYYRACRSAFLALPLESVYPLFIAALKKRPHVLAQSYGDVPEELRYVVYFSDFKEKDYIRLDAFLKRHRVED